MEKRKNPTGPLRSLLALHRSMLFGQLFFVVAAFVLNFTDSFLPTMQHRDQLFQVIALVLAFGGFYFGALVFRKKIDAVKDSTLPLAEKLQAYRVGSLVKWALLEAAVIFATIAFLLTANYSFFALAVTFVILFAVNGPAKLRMQIQLRLSPEEADQL